MSKFFFRWRFYCIYCLVFMGGLAVIYRIFDLSVLQRAFLIKQSRARILRTVSIPSHRGIITDRYGKPLAISTSIQSIWVNPKLFHANAKDLKHLASLIGLSQRYIKRRVRSRGGLSFVYLKRGLSPSIAAKVALLKIPGLFFQKEYTRFYPEGEVSAHVVGFTNIDNKGQEGLELAYNQWLRGAPGKKLSLIHI